MSKKKKYKKTPRWVAEMQTISKVQEIADKKNKTYAYCFREALKDYLNDIKSDTTKAP
ncbi:hypothetical protein [Sulfurimonas sp.]|uniref:hypothetical protein n=1 Tax=Sulfurimonas sp. TaxID=2022749 RepID=UPI0035681817